MTHKSKSRFSTEEKALIDVNNLKRIVKTRCDKLCTKKKKTRATEIDASMRFIIDMSTVFEDMQG